MSSYEFDYFVGKKEKVLLNHERYLTPYCPYDYFTNLTSGDYKESISKVSRIDNIKTEFEFYINNKTLAGERINITLYGQDCLGTTNSVNLTVNVKTVEVKEFRVKPKLMVPPEYDYEYKVGLN